MEIQNIISIIDKKFIIKDNNSQHYYLLLILCFNIYALITEFSQKIDRANIIWLCVTVVSLVVTIMYYVKRNFRNEILTDNISKVKLRINIQNDFIVRIINKKGKIRCVDLNENYTDVQQLIQYCEENNIPVFYDKNKFQLVK